MSSFASPMPPLAPVFTRAANCDGVAVHWSPVTASVAANAQFLDPDPACLVQLRPMLSAEVTQRGAGRKANAVLAVRGEKGEPDMMLLVRVPPHLKKNNRAGVLRALQGVEAFDRKLGSVVREKIQRTYWPAPENRNFRSGGSR